MLGRDQRRGRGEPPQLVRAPGRRAGRRGRRTRPTARARRRRCGGGSREDAPTEYPPSHERSRPTSTTRNRLPRGERRRVRMSRPGSRLTASRDGTADTSTGTRRCRARRQPDRVYGVGKVTGDSQLQSEVLEDLSDARAYRRWLADLARPYLGPDPIEIGSGTGDYALEWVPDVTSFTCTEADETRHDALADQVRRPRRGHASGTSCWATATARRPSTRARSRSTCSSTSPTTSARCGHLARHVRPGGAIVLVVPAFPSAMSRFDRAIGHQRRYTPGQHAARGPRRAGLHAGAGPLRQPGRADQLVRDGQGAGPDAEERPACCGLRPDRGAARPGARPGAGCRSASRSSRSPA